MGQDPAIVDLPAGAAAGHGAVELALEELELVYAFVYARVGNRADAEDLTQQVAMKAIPRLRQGATAASIRGYLFATARTTLSQFWARRFGLPEDHLDEELALPPAADAAATGSPAAAARVQRILDHLPANYRRVLELRFLRGYSLKEVARETGATVGGVKVMQLRALRAAAKLGWDEGLR